MKLTDHQRQELRKCKDDFWYFCRTYLKIRTKQGKIKPLIPYKTQVHLITTAENNLHTYDLKSRKIGGSTIVLARCFHNSRFTPHNSALVAAHTAPAVRKNLLPILKDFEKYLPAWMKGGIFAHEKWSDEELRWAHGGHIIITTASSPSARGGTHQWYHLSEFAHYTNMEVTIGAILSSAPDDAHVVMETTANGMNDAYNLWHLDDGITAKVFFCWMDDTTLVRHKKPKVIPDGMVEYRKKHGLTEPQFNWACWAFFTKTKGSWRLFNQEFPATPDLAFQTSGDRYWAISYPGVVMNKDNQSKFEGLKVYEKPNKFVPYVLGVDAASGSENSDYSAIMCLNAKVKLKPTMAFSYYDRIKPLAFAETVYNLCRQYQALAVVEVQGPGMTVIEYLIRKAWPFMYKRQAFDKTQNRYLERVGFSTDQKSRHMLFSLLHENIEVKRRLNVVDNALKAEINSLIYKNGKPQASQSKWSFDDMHIATGLALKGMEQSFKVEQHIKAMEPQTREEILMGERHNHRIWVPQNRQDDEGIPMTDGVTQQVLDGLIL